MRDAANESRAVVEAFARDFGSADFEQLADDATWTVMGSTVISGTKGKTHMSGALGGFIREAVEGPFTMTVLSSVAEGDKVAARCRSYAKLKAGGTYENEYHNLYTVRGGKIVEIIEYMDTAYVERLLNAAT